MEFLNWASENPGLAFPSMLVIMIFIIVLACIVVSPWTVKEQKGDKK